MIENVETADLDNVSQLITESTVRDFQRDGHICVRGLTTLEEIESYRPFLQDTAEKGVYEKRPLNERDTYGKAFLQIHNLWQRNEICKKFVYAKRFAHAAATLLDVESVHLYHDQALFKEPNGGYTPWHQDQTYWPLEKGSTVTMWLPLENITDEVGSMYFVSGSHEIGDIQAGIISDDSHAAIQQWIHKNKQPVKTYGGMEVGDVTFHAGFTLHSAGSNDSNSVRPVMTIIYVAAGTRILEPTPEQEFDLQLWLGGRKPGEKVGSEQNPILYP